MPFSSKIVKVLVEVDKLTSNVIAYKNSQVRIAFSLAKTGLTYTHAVGVSLAQVSMEPQ